MDRADRAETAQVAPAAAADLRVLRIERAGSGGAQPDRPPLGLRHDERHLRRRVLTLADGTRALIDLAQATMLGAGDVLVLSDGSAAAIEAMPENLYEVRAASPAGLVELAWHIGNRHLAAAIESDRVFILRDPVIGRMLAGLGATVTEVTAPFAPARGAYAEAGHGHSHSHS